MHIILAALSAVAGVIWALYRLQNSGVDLNAFNPFHWARRRRWEKKLGVKPLHRLDKPMEAAAALVLAVLRSEGEISREQKAEAIELFKTEFKLDHPTSVELFSSSSFLLHDTVDIVSEIKHILAPTKALFTPEQSQSSVELIRRASLFDGSISPIQESIINAVSRELSDPAEPQGKWS